MGRCVGSGYAARAISRSPPTHVGGLACRSATPTSLPCPPALLPYPRTQAVVPRTSKVNRMEENLALFAFDLSDQDMQRLDALDGGGGGGPGTGGGGVAAAA